MSIRRSPSVIKPGDIFGRLTVTGLSHQDHRFRRHFHVRCECGTEKTVQGSLMISGNTKSCGCLVKSSAMARRVSRNHSDITAVILGYKRHALRRGHEWLLDRGEVVAIIERNCFYCGAIPANTMITKNSIAPFHYNGIDRIDNGVGYTPSNVVPCCRVCNRAKETMAVQDFAEWAKRLGAMADQWGRPGSASDLFGAAA